MRYPAAARLALLLLIAMAGRTAPVHGQDPPPIEAPTPDLALGPSVLDPPSPGGAFLRSVAVPGWGHAAIGSYGRGAFYVAAQTGTWYALIRTRVRLSETRKGVALRERVLRGELAAEGITEPAEVDARLEQDPGLANGRRLLSARESQQEDWVALGIFLMLLGGADAYVSAHLAGFPDPIDVGVAPGLAGGVELAVRIPLPNR